MKYMGSKRKMLQNGLGKLLLSKASNAKRVVDLFAGSAAVSWFAAENTKCSVLSVDLQNFSAALARSVICRNTKVNPAVCSREWLITARKTQWESPICYEAFALDCSTLDIQQLGERARRLSSECNTPITSAYGGYYYSPMQALAFDALRKHLPTDEPNRSICLAALIAAASKCAAAPGHTAQPFSPSHTSERSIKESWKKDPYALVFKEILDICGRVANKSGQVMVADAVDIAPTLNKDDLVFVDPPYSGVQYSRFYHVLETLTLGDVITVSGTGRYPPIDQRPQSKFSNRGESIGAVRKLLEGLASSRASVLFTFPNGTCSNGLSGQIVHDIASDYFNVKSELIVGRFSTLGGNNFVRKARLKSEELILNLQPRTKNVQKPTPVHTAK